MLIVLATSACGDGILNPRSVPGFYRLRSVNGLPLPYITPPSVGLGLTQIWRGDLVLRPNRTFAHGGSGLGGFVEGSYAMTGDGFVFQMDGVFPGNGTVARVSGDSITFTYTESTDRTFILTYRRAPLPAPLPNTGYRLTSINGRTDSPLIAYDTVMEPFRYLSRIPFDSITLSEGVFFRRHRLQLDSSYTLATGPIGADSDEWTVWGAYERAPSGTIVVLHHYYQPSGWVRARDTLELEGDTLVRSTRLIIGPLEERYTR
jgi:hypothetical protein